MEQITLDAGAAVAAGLISGLVTTLLAMGLIIAMPRRFPLNPLYLCGSHFRLDTTAAYGVGLILVLNVSAGYGVVIAAVFVGFEVEAVLPLWGALAGCVLSVVTGTSLAYMRTLNPAVRKGLLGDPGPFLLRYGAWSMAQLLALHAVFGLLAGFFYQVMS